MHEDSGGHGLVRLATEGDLDSVADIYAAARAFMRAHGNAAQWPDHYPTRVDAECDLALGRSGCSTRARGPSGA